ncbi:Photosynthetic reaction center cytochrome C subunit [Candidatus Thermokryptus mobilis]|uniref:Photosynthetic reaction center cytochrome c subunit n=1 Tax=Candidatus Thermokryptus mobilis TaxID=1643428 RepID=A0A0S4NDL2_9BACT|nr:c-type cytochrome [Candidatus Thermokryptus mobilis]CUU08969.1 Photosynthetic reaction center cytochrome C subunit [Candidatus Thermokryptus mobilis]
MRKTFLFYTGLILAVIISLIIVVNLKKDEMSNDANGQTRRFGRNIQVLTDVQTKEQLTKIMEDMANSLGVKCNYCHNVNNYASDEKETKRKARVMLKMVLTINRDFINWDRAEIVDCYTCHRGQTKPQARSASK